MSRFDSTERKNGHDWCISRSSSILPRRDSTQCSTAAPKPYQPGSIRRDWLQLNTQGMARMSSMVCVARREAGRLPILSSESSVIGVDCRQ